MLKIDFLTILLLESEGEIVCSIDNKYTLAIVLL